MEIFKNIQKIPGGLMIVPLFLGVLMNTFIPQILQVGGLTTAMFSSAGTNTTIAITLFCVGAQIDFRQAGEVLKRGIDVIQIPGRSCPGCRNCTSVWHERYYGNLSHCYCCSGNKLQCRTVHVTDQYLRR